MRTLGLVLIAFAIGCGPEKQGPPGACQAMLDASASNSANSAFNGTLNSAKSASAPQQQVLFVCASDDQSQQLQIVLNDQRPAVGVSYTLGPFNSPGGWISYLEDDATTDPSTHRSWTSSKGTAGITAVDGKTVTVSFSGVPLDASPQQTDLDQAVGQIQISGTATVLVDGL